MTADDGLYSGRPFLCTVCSDEYPCDGDECRLEGAAAAERRARGRRKVAPINLPPADPA